MTTSIKTSHRPLAVLNLPGKLGALSQYVAAIVKAMTGNQAFPAPSPTLAEITSAVSDLQAAETAAVARTKGAVITRNTKRAALVMLLQQLKAYVQKTADADPENGASIIGSAGMGVRKTPTRAARTFGASPGLVSGSAKLVTVTASRRASYEWQYSTDGGKTWVTAPVTLQSKTTILGLPAGTTVMFRSRAVTKVGEGEWTQVASLLVK
jgi:hypothetical protein